MIYRHIFVVEAVLQTIRQEVRRAGLKETGGPLAGYVSPDQAVVVTHAGGPGPRADLRLRSVLIDGAAAQSFCDTINRASGGRLDYIGDWHRHPGWLLAPSDDDQEAMRLMASYPHCPVAYPIALIYRSLPEKFLVYTWNKHEMLELTPHTMLATIPS